MALVQPASSLSLQELVPPPTPSNVGQAPKTTPLAMASDIHNDGRLISIRVVVQGDDDTYFLFVFTVEPSDDGEQAMLKLHHFLVSEVWPHPSVHSHGLVNRLFWKDVIEMATLSTVSLTMLARYWKGMNTNRSH
jgi:hypothetical protein